MKISFLVTYYNQEQYVRQSMDSILAIDKPSEWEILVGDDGSSDRTVEIVREYVGRYPENIRLYVMPRDKEKRYYPVKRASENRIHLLEHCTGECFCVLDGDDFYCDTAFVKEAMSVFDENPDISVAAFGYRYYRNGQWEEKIRLPAGVGPRVDTKDYIEHWYLHAGAGVHRIAWDRSRLSYIRALGYFDDNDIMFNGLNYGQMYYINRCVYAYRQTGESVFTSMNAVEQAVLNVQGFDVDKRLIDPSYLPALVNRNKSFILTAYFWRRRLKDVLGKEKYDVYVTSSEQIEDSLTYRLLTFSSLSRDEKNRIHRLVFEIVKENPVLSVKAFIKYMIGGQ